MANFWLAFESDLLIIPALNKIDLKNANVHQAEQQMKEVFDIDPASVLKVLFNQSPIVSLMWPSFQGRWVSASRNCWTISLSTSRRRQASQRRHSVHSSLTAGLARTGRVWSA